MTEDRRMLLQAWTVAQENARHFNDILMKIRAGTVVFFGAGLAALNALSALHVKPLAYVLAAAWVVVLALYVLDRWYYHILLLATVTWSRAVEKALFTPMQLVGLSQHVSDVYSQASIIPSGTGRPGRPPQKKVEASRSAADRIAIYYGLFLTALATLTGWAFARGYAPDANEYICAGAAALLTAIGVLVAEWKGHGVDFLALPPPPPTLSDEDEAS